MLVCPECGTPAGVRKPIRVRRRAVRLYGVGGLVIAAQAGLIYFPYSHASFSLLHVASAPIGNGSLVGSVVILMALSPNAVTVRLESVGQFVALSMLIANWPIAIILAFLLVPNLLAVAYPLLQVVTPLFLIPVGLALMLGFGGGDAPLRPRGRRRPSATDGGAKPSRDLD